MGNMPYYTSLTRGLISLRSNIIHYYCHPMLISYATYLQLTSSMCISFPHISYYNDIPLGKVRENCGKEALGALSFRNSPLCMAQCGSKGSPLNISQVKTDEKQCSCVLT